jgi:N-acetyl-gamma-glutamyl-phosphate reductase
VKARVGVVGARGFVGAELVRLVAKHPRMSLELVTSAEAAGARVAEVIEGVELDARFEAPSPEDAARRDLDVVFLGLPNGASAPWVEAFAGARAVVVDLGADHRFDDAWAYGQPERNRAAIRGARRVASPGCYATAAQLAIEPIKELVRDVAAFGVSGYSGAGATPSRRNDPDALRDAITPYALVDHVHERELRRQLGLAVRFTPHVAPFFRGLSVTVSFALDRPSSRADLARRFDDRYADEPFVRIVDEAPHARDAALRHDVTIGGLAIGADGVHGAVVAALDNLRGGAATQALRCANLALGLDEAEGIHCRDSAVAGRDR